MCVFYSVSIICISQVGLNLMEPISIYITSTSEQLLKSTDIVDHCRVNFCISKLLIQCNTGSCCVLITGPVDIDLYVYAGLSVCERGFK